MSEMWDVQSDEIAQDYDEEQQLLQNLFQTKHVYTISQIKNVMSTGHLTFAQLLERYEETLIGWLDDEAQAILQVLQDGAYLAQVWSWIEDTDTYKQWVNIYLENKDQLIYIARYYIDHPDYGYDLRQSALEAKNELYLAQTQPGEPADLNFDPYTAEYEEPDTEFINAPLMAGDSDYDRFLGEDDSDFLFDDRGMTSVPIEQAEAMELKPQEYLSLRSSDVGKQIKAMRDTAIEYRKENFRLRRDWKLLGLHRKPKYLDEYTLQKILKAEHRDELNNIAKGLTDLAHQGYAPQDLLLLLIDGTYFDFVSYKVKIPSTLGANTLQEFGAYYADEVLDYAQSIQDPPGWHEASEAHYSQLIDKIDPSNSLLYDESRVEWSRLFNEVVLEHIFNGASVKDAYKQAYHACKMAQSPQGEIAYRQAMAVGKSYGQAMHDFYEAAYASGDIIRPRDRVISVHPERMIILTAASQYTNQRTINWNIARLKARNNELYIPVGAEATLKRRLFNAVKSLRWDTPTILKLKE
jgi:hypothetical protein